jgi:hypothetical protein
MMMMMMMMKCVGNNLHKKQELFKMEVAYMKKGKLIKNSKIENGMEKIGEFLIRLMITS